MRKGKYVRISRQWHAPEIRMEVTGKEIAIEMELGDFIKAIAAEVGRPIAIVTQAQLLAKLEAAAAAVTLSMKQETTAIVR